MSRTFCPIPGIVASHICALYRYAALPFMLLLTCCNGPVKKDIPGTNTVTIALNAPIPLPAPEFQRLHAAATAWFDSALRRNFNGSMLVAKNGNIIFEVYNGNAHVGSTDAITDSTAFHIASVSKTFTAMAILKLWQDGKLNIDDEFGKYFPAFNYPGITIRNLLSHRSGLPNYVYFMEDLGWDETIYITNEDVLNFMINRKAEIKNIALPGNRFNYCNTNYVLLALLIEKQSGKSYSDFLKESFFAPLDMSNTFVYNRSDSIEVTPSYDGRGGMIPFNYFDVVYGDKNIYSTPKDLLKWDRALTSGVLFKENTLAEAYAPYSNEKPGVRNYGLGWRMNIYPTGKKMIYHNGWWHGNNASFIRLLEDSATIIVLGNKYNPRIYHVNRLANLFGHYLDIKDSEEPEAVRTPPAAVKKRPAKAVRRSPAVKAKKTVVPVKKKTAKK